jgi:virginiamycin B lyase
MSKQERNVWVVLLGVATFGLALWLAILANGTIAAAPDVSITGVVTDDTGKPLRGAPVTAKVENMSISRYSDASGKYQITGLKPGNYKISATAYGYGPKSVDKEIGGGVTDVTFRLKPNWNPSLISTSEYISAFDNEKDMRNVEETCTPCHNFSWIMRRRGMTADEWSSFIPVMGNKFITPKLSPEKLTEIGISLEKYFGPDSSLPPKEQVHHVEISDEALNSTIRMYQPPTPNIDHSLSVGKDGRVWFSEFDYFSNKLGMFDPSRLEFKEYPIPTDRAMPHNTWVARNGMVWVTELGGDNLAMLDPETGKITEYPVPNDAGAHTLKEGPTGNIWLVGRKVSRFNPETKKFDTYDAAGYDVAVDSHNNGWSTDYKKGSIDKADSATGQVKRYPVPGATFLRGIEVDAQDNVWFGDVMGHRLGRIDHKTEQMTFYQPSTPNYSIYGIVVDKKTGNIWTADYLGANVTRLDPTTGKFTVFPFPSEIQMIRFFGEDPQGRIWFTDFASGRIGVLETGESKMAAQR